MYAGHGSLSGGNLSHVRLICRIRASWEDARTCVYDEEWDHISVSCLFGPTRLFGKLVPHARGGLVARCRGPVHRMKSTGSEPEKELKSKSWPR